MKSLPYLARSLLAKSREAALLAVETYNRPNAGFKSGAYIVLMIIAWTSLFHAVFLRRNIKPYYKKKNSRRYEKIDGDYKWWELSECLTQYFKDQNPPIRKNLEFFVVLRNKVEHRAMPEIDPEIFGECQALLLNYEEFIVSEFGDKYAIRGGLTFALQLTPTIKASPPSKRQLKDFRTVNAFIEQFRASLSDDILSNISYSFKVYLDPKIGSHAAKDSIAIEFVKYDPSKPEEMKQYDRIVAMIKPKQIPVANLGLLKPGEVVRRVKDALGCEFNMYHHQLCYRHFNARPKRESPDPSACDTRYCIYDSVHRDYLYTEEWVQHLIKSLSDKNTFEFLLKKKAEQNISKSIS